MKHLLVAVTAHGFGHSAQLAPLLKNLAQTHPDLAITVQSTLPEAYLRGRFGPLRFWNHSADIGMVMRSALDVDVEGTIDAYRRFHRDWDRHFETYTQTLNSLKPDVLLANVPYLPIAAANACGIPALGFCSLNWFDIFKHYCGRHDGAAEIYGRIEACYQQADFFIQPQPSMPMENLHNRQEVGLVAVRGIDQRMQIKARYGLPADARLVTVTLGGLDMPLNLHEWQQAEGVYWITEARRDAPSHWISVESLNMPFVDIIASSDALVTKPGYGAFSESACAGVPVLYVSRGDWPEEPYLVAWMNKHGNCEPLKRKQLAEGRVMDALEILWSRKTTMVTADGIDECLGLLHRITGW